MNGLPHFFSKKEFEVVRSLANSIWPKTNTPGALDVMVDRIIDANLSNNYSKEFQTAFKKNLNDLMKNCRKQTGKSFSQLNKSDRLSFLRPLDDSAYEEIKGKYDIDLEDKPFIFQVKELVVSAYFMTEEGCKNFLKYDPIPGNFEGCIDYESVGGTWAIT